MEGWRKIHINNEVFLYKIGKGYVSIKLNNGKTIYPNLVEVTSKSWDVLERGQWKKTSDGYVLPSHIKDYLIKRVNNEKI